MINTKAAVFQAALGLGYYLHVYDGWLFANAIEGPWTLAGSVPVGLNTEALQLAKAGVVDLLDGGPKANPKPS